MQLPKTIRDNVLMDAAPRFAKENGASWREWLKVVKSAKYPQGLAHSVGLLSSALVKAIEFKGIDVRSALIVADDRVTNHLKGKHKTADKTGTERAIPDNVFSDLPKYLTGYQVALWQESKNNIVLVLKQSKDKDAYAAIEINWKTRNRDETVTNSIRSLGLVHESDLKDVKRYEVIDGEWN